MAMRALPTSALSSLEAMLHSLMRGGAGGGDDDAPVDDDTVASPPLPPLPARPTPRGRRHPSRSPRGVRAAGPSAPPPLSSPSPPPPPPIEFPSSFNPLRLSSTFSHRSEDARTKEDVSPLVKELERKAAEVEAQLRHKEEENAELKRRIESYHIRWLEYEIRIKSLEEAFHEQMAALQMAQDAARRAEETAYEYDRRESSDPHTETGEEPPPVRLWHGRDRMCVGASQSAVSRRLGAEFRRQSRTLERGAAALVVVEPPAANSSDDLKKLKAQFRAWTKDYKAHLHRAQAEIDRDRRRRVISCWI